MFTFTLLMSLMNMLGGRWSDVWGGEFFIDGRWFWRVIMPSIAAGAFALENGLGLWAFYIGLFAMPLGCIAWSRPGWSFTEQTGIDDPSKYPAFIRSIGEGFFPLDDLPTTNRKRAILMKGFRGLYDFITFALLTPINPWALLYWPATFSMGFLYWLTAKIVPGSGQDVLVSENVYGAMRGILIGLVISTAVYKFDFIRLFAQAIRAAS